MCQVGAGVGTISATHIVCALWNPRIRPQIRGSRKSRLQSPRDLVYKVDIIRVSASLAQFSTLFWRDSRHNQDIGSCAKL